MTGIKISALPAIVTPTLNDIFPVTSAGVTYKETVQQLVTFINNPAVLTGFLPLAGGTMTGPINMGGFGINSMLNPVNPQDAATKAYVDLIGAGLNVLLAVYAASTVNLTATYANGAAGVGATLTNSGAQVAFAIDGVSPPINSRILIKNQTSTFQNGIYSLTTVGTGATNWVLTRTTDYDIAGTQIKPGNFVIVNNGTVNVATGWVQTATVVTIGTDPILFSPFLAGGFANAGTNTNITSMIGLTGYLQAPLGVKDANGNIVVQWNSSAGAVNYISELNNSTGNSPTISALGSDANIALTLTGKGTSGVNIVGTSTNNSAPVGDIGEDFSINVPKAAAILLSSSTNVDITSQLLQPGNYDVWGNAFFDTGGNAAVMTTCGVWVYTVSMTQPDKSYIGALNINPMASCGINAPGITLKISAPTTVFLSVFAVFSTGAVNVCGNLFIRRRY